MSAREFSKPFLVQFSGSQAADWLVRLDYRLREVRVLDFMRLTGDETKDFRCIARVYEGVTGYHPQNAAPIRLIEPSVPRTETVVK